MVDEQLIGRVVVEARLVEIAVEVEDAEVQSVIELDVRQTS